MNNLLKILLLQLTTFLIYNSTAQCMEKRHNCNDSASMNDLSKRTLDISSPLEESVANKEIPLKEACSKYESLKRDYETLENAISNKIQAIQAVMDNYKKLFEDLTQIFEKHNIKFDKNNMKFALPEEKINEEISETLGIEKNIRINGEELVRRTYDKLIELNNKCYKLAHCIDLDKIHKEIFSGIENNEKITASDKRLTIIKENVIKLQNKLNQSNNSNLDPNKIYEYILSEIKDKKEIEYKDLVISTTNNIINANKQINQSNIAAIFQKILIISKNLIDYLHNIIHMHRYLEEYYYKIDALYDRLRDCNDWSSQQYQQLYNKLIDTVKQLYEELTLLKKVPKHDFINTAYRYFVKKDDVSIITALNVWYKKFCALQNKLQNTTTVDDYKRIYYKLNLWNMYNIINQQSKDCLIKDMYILNNDFKYNKEIMDKINSFVQNMQTKLCGKEKK